MMYFKQVREIVDGRKTCTQRVVKEGETAIERDGAIIGVKGANGRVKWLVGGEYCVSPGRGKPTALVHASGQIIYPIDRENAAQLREFNYQPIKIMLARMERQHLLTVDEVIAKAEGVESVGAYEALWRTINKTRGSRWEDNPKVWRLWFEFVGL